MNFAAEGEMKTSPENPEDLPSTATKNAILNMTGNIKNIATSIEAQESVVATLETNATNCRKKYIATMFTANDTTPEECQPAIKEAEKNYETPEKLKGPAVTEVIKNT